VLFSVFGKTVSVTNNVRKAKKSDLMTLVERQKLVFFMKNETFTKTLE
jgi:hypothetical protein